MPEEDAPSGELLQANQEMNWQFCSAAVSFKNFKKNAGAGAVVLYHLCEPMQ